MDDVGTNGQLNDARSDGRGGDAVAGSAARTNSSNCIRRFSSKAAAR